MKIYIVEITTPYINYAYYDIVCAYSSKEAEETCIKYHNLSELKIMVNTKELEDVYCNSKISSIISSKEIY